mmetsp:Transcript_20323/g.19272  ORF Transcript_20323/g.19272 Transcript_20323/m.19272 type:complete len:81 (+) Transcript_20323:1191-1433(+)
MKSLAELNLRKNKIIQIKDLSNLPSLQKLYLSNNQIASLDSVKELPALSDITLESNPIERMSKFHNFLKSKFPSILYVNL